MLGGLLFVSGDLVTHDLPYPLPMWNVAEPNDIVTLYDVGCFMPNELACVISSGNQWWTVRVVTSSGVVGWVNAELLRKA